VKQGWLFPLLLAVAGCSETFTITRGTLPSGFDDANLQCVQTTNHIRLRDGTVVSTRQLYIARDSVSWMQPDGHRQQVRLWEVALIDNVNHLRGTRNGVVAGMMAGLGGGLALASAIHAHNTLGDVEAAAVTSVATFAGAGAGIAVGRFIGYRTVIKFDSAAAIPADTMRPPARRSAGWSMPESSDSTNKR
jgi:hypothetical protein